MSYGCSNVGIDCLKHSVNSILIGVSSKLGVSDWYNILAYVHHLFPNFFHLHLYLCILPMYPFKCQLTTIKDKYTQEKAAWCRGKSMNLERKSWILNTGSTGYWMSDLHSIHYFLSLNFIWNKGWINETIYVKVFDKVQVLIVCIMNDRRWKMKTKQFLVTRGLNTG